jgi:hypothetical protein
MVAAAGPAGFAQEDGGLETGAATVYAPQPLPDDTGQQYGVYDDTASGPDQGGLGAAAFAAGSPDGHDGQDGHGEYAAAGYDAYGGYEQPAGHEAYGTYSGYGTYAGTGDQDGQFDQSGQPLADPNGLMQQGGQPLGDPNGLVDQGGQAGQGAYAEQQYGYGEYNQYGTYEQYGQYPQQAVAQAHYPEQTEQAQYADYGTGAGDGRNSADQVAYQQQQPEYQQQYAQSGYDASYASYGSHPEQQQYRDPFATDTPPGGVWVPPQRETAQGDPEAGAPYRY